MDPQQRLLLEVAWEALENAGIPPQTIRGTQTSVFVGHDRLRLHAHAVRRRCGPRISTPTSHSGTRRTSPPGGCRISSALRGPAVVVDTACSSSLVAVHLACQSLRWRESDTALAGGTNLMLSPGTSIACSRWGMLSPEGRCKTFDAGADGYVRSEGCGVVVLKRLSDALRDGDRVLAVVRGSAVNQDGASSGLTVPNGPAQQAVLAPGAGVGAVAARRHRLRRGARHRHTARRSDRTRCAEPGLRRARGARAAGARIGEDQSRSSGGRGRDRRFHQDRAEPCSHGYIPATSELRASSTPHASEGASWLDHRRRRHGVAGGRAAASGRGVLVRCQWHQCACGGGAGSGSWSRWPRRSDRWCRRWWCRARRRRGWRRGRRCWPTGWTATGAAVALADVAPHAEPSPGPARQVRHGVSRAIAPRRWPGCARWPPGRPAPGVVGAA